jgi:hypothetical protein
LELVEAPVEPNQRWLECVDDLVEDKKRDGRAIDLLLVSQVLVSVGNGIQRWARLRVHREQESIGEHDLDAKKVAGRASGVHGGDHGLNRITDFEERWPLTAPDQPVQRVLVKVQAVTERSESIRVWIFEVEPHGRPRRELAFNV